MGCFNIWNNGILELSDLCLESITAIKEEDIIATLFNQLVDLFWAKVNSTADYTVFINLDLIRVSKSNKLWTNLDLELWKIISRAI